MKEQILGFFTPWIIYLLITILHYFLPGSWVTGYVKNTKTGSLLKYRLNGRLVLFSTIFIWFVLGYLDWVPYEWLYLVRWYSLSGAFVFGLIFSFWMVFSAPSTGKSWLADLYLGRPLNPQFKEGRIDAKMWLYLIGAVMLELNILSFIGYHHLLFGTVSPGLILCGSMLTYFIIDYLIIIFIEGVNQCKIRHYDKM